MSKIECETCGELIEITGSSVVLPYMCNSCMNDKLADEMGYDYDYYDDPCPAIDSVQELDPTGHLIVDLKLQNERLTQERNRAERLLDDYRNRPEEPALHVTKAALEESEAELNRVREQVDTLKDAAGLQANRAIRAESVIARVIEQLRKVVEG